MTSKNTHRNNASTATKTNWDKPISRAFYEKLRTKVKGIITALGYVSGYTDEMMKMLDRYMANGEVPTRYYCDEYIMALFFALRYDVDEAMRRSAAARQRAAERRARKESQNEPESNAIDKEKSGEKTDGRATKSSRPAKKTGMVTARRGGDAPVRGVPERSAPSFRGDANRSAKYPSGARGW